MTRKLNDAITNIEQNVAKQLEKQDNKIASQIEEQNEKIESIIDSFSSDISNQFDAQNKKVCCLLKTFQKKLCKQLCTQNKKVDKRLEDNWTAIREYLAQFEMGQLTYDVTTGTYRTSKSAMRRLYQALSYANKAETELVSWQSDNRTVEEAASQTVFNLAWGNPETIIINPQTDDIASFRARYEKGNCDAGDN